MFRLLLAVLLSLLAAAPAAAKPFVAILADSRGTVATDLLAPYAILAESGAVEVKVVARDRAAVRLTPGYAWVRPQMTLAELARHRPDVIIVPALEVEDDPATAAWLRGQLAAGARVMSICNGARVLAKAGLLEGRQATVHWFSVGRLKKSHPNVRWRQDRRWVTDGPITTTAGISAGEPATLALLAELAGEPVMRATAARMGQPLPDPRHDGTRYRLTLGGMVTTVLNRAQFWAQEDVAIPLAPGFDELALGTAIDAWSRTYRSTGWAVGPAGVTSRHGLQVFSARGLPERFDRRVALPGPDVMARTLAAVGRAYGRATGRFVALQFEHPAGALEA
ncbi:MAG TPA: DJ-1/PfpI family protein [Phenylobacterium sp.]|nr:DJ-1/PfpI family protein [Phenylobacterium sp.]